MMVAPVLLGVICLFMMLRIASDLDAGHPMEFFAATCFAWALISLVVLTLRPMNLVSLPIVLIVAIYINIFFYVLSLY